MYNTIKLFVLLLLPFSVVAQPINLPSDNHNWTPLPQMEIGKVKRVSKEQLPPTMKKMAEDNISEIQKGYELVSEEFFIYSSNYQNRLRNESDIKSNIRVDLANIEMTDLKNYVYEGIIPDGPTLNGPWTSVIRVFRRQDGVVLMLNEWDYVADGGAVVTINELMNTTVANTPAVFSIKKSPSGRILTELSWATSKKYFAITVWDDIDKKRHGKEYNRKWLLNLANSLP